MSKDNQEKSKLDKLMGMVETLVSKVSNLEAENQELKKQVLTTKGKKFKITGAGNQVDSEWKENLEERNRYAEEHPQPVHLQKEAGFKGLEDECPFCLHNDKPSLLDLVKSGQYQCRSCGKSWNKKLIGLPYAEEMENGQFDTKLLNAYVENCKREKVAA